MARIIITGASDGIGAEMARQLAQTHGSRLQLTLAARNAGNLQPWQSNAGPWGRRC
jgi:short-subunit dehydrogenase